MDPRLDPDVRALQEARAKTKPVRMADAGYQSIRDWLEDLPHPTGLPEMAGTDTLQIPGPGGDLRLDVYTPGERPSLPAVVYFHGGGMVMGSNHSFRPTAINIAHSSGAKVIAVDYRLAPEHPVPAQLEDCYAATEWVAANAAELGIDHERICVMGDSAGGTLAAGVALKARDSGGPDLFCQVLIYPGVDADMAAESVTEFAEGPGLTLEDIRYLRGLAGEGAGVTSPYVLPILAEDLSGLPQTIVAVAECDPVRDWGERYAARLVKARVQTTVTRYPGLTHGFVMQVDHLARARLAISEIGALLDAKFRHPLPW
ncbi:alpha/beta hydrolase [Actinomadura sp. WMMA1423]|uniref:alpha/beta hydrolase n=1 Tax=Actinomadura sp. WMMA1423 TaxID=2591108 RepID=UPI00114666F7|nr:alpha/beta hydrolase [Actinomadura sp. WMMA1423]